MTDLRIQGKRIVLLDSSSNSIYSLPDSAGTSGNAVITDGAGKLFFGGVNLDAVLAAGDSSNLNATILGNVRLGNITSNNITVENTEYPKLILEKTNSQTIADVTSQDVTFNSTIVDTANGFHTDDVYYVCQKSGYYQIDIAVGIQDSDSQQRDFILAFMESSDSGSTYATLMNDGARYHGNPISDSQRQISGLRFLTAGNYYKVKAFYNRHSGSGSGTFTTTTASIQGSTDDDMERVGSVTRWSMWKVL